MKIEWMVTDVTAVRSPDRAERAILGVILAGRFFDFWPIQATFVVGEPLCDVGTPFLSSYNCTQGHLVKIKLLVTDAAAVRSLTERNMLFWG